jgi:peptidoglycan/xylan/chitin deacetylase (PgdA/CDA1 family)
MRLKGLFLIAGVALALALPANGNNAPKEVFRADDEAAMAAVARTVETEDAAPLLPGVEPVPDAAPQTAAEAHQEAVETPAPAPVAPAMDASTPVAKPRVALTFDDGPTPFTLQILDILKARKVKASFFMVGDNIKRHPEIAKAVVEGGFELGNHTMHHFLPSRLTDAALRDDVEGTSALIAAMTGKPPAMFRSPYGSRSKRYLSEAARGNMDVVFWNVDPHDWKHSSPESMAAEIAVALKPGAVILLHDGGGNRARTVQALPLVLDEIERRGYEIVLVSEIETAHKGVVIRAAQIKAQMQHDQAAAAIR